MKIEGWGTPENTQPEPEPEATKTIASNDPEALYWASLDATARKRAQELQIKGWGTDGNKAQEKICDVYYFHTDQVGLPEELSNAQGKLVWRATYKTWGNTVAESWEVVNLDGGRLHELDKGDRPQGEAQQQNLRFQGQYLDRDTGLHYNTFRYYDPDIGRFISPDPIGLEGGINLGSYSPNPISWIDPLGLIDLKIPGATGETSVHANPGPDVVPPGARAEHAPAHIHLGDNDGPRVNTRTFQPYSAEDARLMTPKQKKFIANLSNRIKNLIRRRSTKVYKTGSC